MQLLTVAEVRERLRLSDREVRQMLADGRLPAVRLQGVRAVRVPEQAVDAIVKPGVTRGGTLVGRRS